MPANLSPCPRPLPSPSTHSSPTRIAQKQVVHLSFLSIDSSVCVNCCDESLARAQLPSSCRLSSDTSGLLSHFLLHCPTVVLVETYDDALLCPIEPLLSQAEVAWGKGFGPREPCQKENLDLACCISLHNCSTQSP